jgi:hypothetical protein
VCISDIVVIKKRERRSTRQKEWERYLSSFQNLKLKYEEFRNSDILNHTFIQQCTGNSSHCDKARKKNERHVIWKEEDKNFYLKMT